MIGRWLSLSSVDDKLIGDSEIPGKTYQRDDKTEQKKNDNNGRTDVRTDRQTDKKLDILPQLSSDHLGPETETETKFLILL